MEFQRAYLDDIIDRAVREGKTDVTVDNADFADALVDALMERADAMEVSDLVFDGTRSAASYRIRGFHPMKVPKRLFDGAGSASPDPEVRDG